MCEETSVVEDKKDPTPTWHAWFLKNKSTPIDFLFMQQKDLKMILCRTSYAVISFLIKVKKKF